MSLIRCLAIATVLLGLAGLGIQPASAQMMNEMTFTLSAQNNSGLNGTARLTAMGDQTRVVIELKGPNVAGPMPAHIHDGTCDKLNPAPKYPLTAVANGRSETTVNVSLQALMSAPYAINVHKSPQEVSVYVACGELDELNMSHEMMAPAPAAGQPPVRAAGPMQGQPQGQPMGQLMGQPAPMIFTLRPQNNSGERGAVVLVPMGQQTRVSIRLRGEPAGGSQPAHIHDGSCENLNPAPRYPLNNVVNGRSDTVVNATVQDIMGSAHAVNIHKSAQEVSTYVACGNLNDANMLRPPAAPGAGPVAAGQPRPPAGPRPQTQMPRGPAAGPMPMTMPRTGDMPLLPFAALGVAALGLGLLIRRRLH